VALADEVEQEILRLGGRSGRFLLEQVREAAGAYLAGRDREAVRLLRPVRQRIPDALGVRELLGLSLYRAGRYREAARELEEWARRSGSALHHPELMDCARAQGRADRVEALWEELEAASPDPDVVIEGRIVRAATRADAGALDEAIRQLTPIARRLRRPTRPAAQRVWYVLADLEERAGNLAAARRYWSEVRAADPTFADVAERLRAIS
jgi:tetratricopeptide (TPR) repeat protein